MLSLYLFIRDSLALSLPEQEELKAKCFRDSRFLKGRKVSVDPSRDHPEGIEVLKPTS